MKTATTHFLTLFLAAGMFLGGGGGADAFESAGHSVNTRGLNVLIIGHSLTHCLRALEPFAAMVGHSKHRQALYTDSRRRNPIPLSNGNQSMDARIVAQALLGSRQEMGCVDYEATRNVGSDEEYAPKFAAEAFKTNPQCQIFIYGNWPTPQESFEKPSLGRSEAHIEHVGAAIDKAFPHAPKTRMMPCSLVVRELGRLADRGELPGVASHFELFSDGDHPSKVAAYAINVLVMSMLYNESPLAYPADIHEVDSRGRPVRGDVFEPSNPAETATVVKRVVWDVLQTYPPAGMPPRLVDRQPSFGAGHSRPALQG